MVTSDLKWAKEFENAFSATKAIIAQIINGFRYFDAELV